MILKKLIKNLLFRTGYSIHRKAAFVDYSYRFQSLLRYFECEALLDVGANEGQFATEILHSGFTGNIYSVEPLSEENLICQQRSKRFSKWNVLEPMAIGIQDEDNAIINISQNRASSSLMNANENFEHVHRQATVADRQHTKTMTLESVLLALRLNDRNNLALKLDTQGFDYDILKSSERALQSFSLIGLECSLVELYDGQSLWYDIDKLLTKNGFKIIGLHPGHSNKYSGELLQFDAIYAQVSKT